ncbi:hypothetical protein GHT09_011012 [Marmota monax]|uniref:Uncharacterized protein n=1 Tax=Marmota monax TaxID=9995 RepID=A0A834QH52_MARMO|nr:hypothetical protein GHT09_011012 [Marmota monax]
MACVMVQIPGISLIIAISTSPSGGSSGTFPGATRVRMQPSRSPARIGAASRDVGPREAESTEKAALLHLGQSRGPSPDLKPPAHHGLR